jgi:hypothetical protein
MSALTFFVCFLLLKKSFEVIDWREFGGFLGSLDALTKGKYATVKVTSFDLAASFEPSCAQIGSVGPL